MGINYDPLLSNFFYTLMSLSLYKNLSKTKKSREAKRSSDTILQKKKYFSDYFYFMIN